ncbi:hypothetical protein [Micavibrio aeruginosavorus]|uniref:Uncharacterized protein n=1 Tax=Micavibrio aeruginosavorus (strain ARL-13) TaxID=856793 RepID=G2KNT1_MICAA|nr:hypothetical protein [Micavibrio aeruginosavorus]AEP10726.1 hypothetical protein MICA_2424 [Micavibrio aeruginosavorus ARL-13]
MITLSSKKTIQLAALMAVLVLAGAGEAHAGGAGSNFSAIAENIVESIADLPGLLSGIAYMFGILLGVLGILKIKDHVENPGQVALKDGAIRLAAGGGLFALPIVYDAMLNTVGADGTATSAATLNAISMGVN